VLIFSRQEKPIPSEGAEEELVGEERPFGSEANDAPRGLEPMLLESQFHVMLTPAKENPAGVNQRGQERRLPALSYSA
jgi:hypothetical protein